MPSVPDASDSKAHAEAAPAAVRDALASLTGELVLQMAAGGRLEWCNPQFETLLGRRLAEMAGSGLADLLPVAPGHRKALARAADRLAQGVAFAGVELELQPALREAVWLRVSAHALDAGTMLCLMQDVGASKRLELEAKHLRELLDMAQEFGRVGVWEREIPSGAGRWDRHVFGIWGFDPQAGTPSHEEALARVHPDDRPLLNYRQSTEQAGRYQQRYRVVREDGSTRWVQSQWEVKAGTSGRPERAVGIMMDDSDVVELARSLDATSAQLALAIELGNIAIWRHDLATDRVHYNDRALQVLDLAARPDGIPLSELRARVHPDELSIVTNAAQEAINSHRPTDIEARFRHSDGSWRTILTRRVVERAADGTAVAFVGVALDVTERAEQRRRADHIARRLETATAAAGLGVWSRDTLTLQGEWNAQMFALTGRSPARGAPSRREWLDEIVHPDDRAILEASFTTINVSTEGHGELEFRIVRPDGEVRWLIHRARRETIDGRQMIFGVAFDVTDRRRAEQALRDADARAALATRGAGIGTWDLDLIGGIERWDEQMFHLRGMQPAERPPTPQERLALLHPDDRGGNLDANPALLQSAETTGYEFRVRLPDGSYRWLASRSTPVSDATGRTTRRVGVNWDVTQSRLADAERQERTLAQRENQAKSRFMARMSHELRTPLNAMLGFAQLLQAEAELPPRQRRRLDLIRTAGEHLLALINDVLDLSGLQSGELRLDLQPIDLAELVAETLPLVEPMARQHGVSLLSGPLAGVVQADRTRMRQVLINLLSNGIKYNRRRGRVSIDTQRVDGRVQINVVDSGRGLAPEQMAHLFEPYNRLGLEREGIEGTGIGLAIVKALVERMGGTVSVASQPGGGTTFSVELPAATPTTPGEGRQESLPHLPSSKDPPRGRLLYIEDNPVNVLLVEELVSHRPELQLVSALTGEEGVKLAIDWQPQLVLVDVQLPDIDGFEVLRRLRADPRTTTIRCVALSANALPNDIARALAAGFAEYWTKPIHFGRFLAGLDTLFKTA